MRNEGQEFNKHFQNGTVDDSAEDVRVRTTSKVYDAFTAVWDRLESLDAGLQTLELRLLPVCNTYPRPTPGTKEATDEKPTGDSEILEKLYRIGIEVDIQKNRVNDLIDHLDI